MLPARIRARLFLLIAMALLPVLGLLGWIYYHAYHTRYSQAVNAELEVAQGVAATFEACLDDIRRQSLALGDAIVTVDPHDPARATQLLHNAVARYKTIRNFSWVSPGGKVLASSLPPFVGTDLSVRPYCQQVMSGAGWAIGDLTPRGMYTSAPTVGMATGVRGDDGSLYGIVVAGIEPADLGKVTLTQQRPGAGAYAIFDRQGVVVYHSAVELSWEQRTAWLKSDWLLREALKTGQTRFGMTDIHVRGGRWISARVPIGNIGWVAGAGVPVAVALAPLWRDLLQDAGLALLVLAAALGLAYLVAQTIARPLARLEKDAQALGAGQAASRDDPYAPVEARHLRGTIERMAGDLIQRSEALREGEQLVRQQLDTILSPEGNLGSLELADLVDVPAVQALIDDFYRLAHIPMSIIDLKGRLLVGAGWQKVCTEFHRANPETCRHCLESDTQLTRDIPEGEFRLYKCKNNMWDAATPIVVGGQRLGHIFTGQFFFQDEVPDRELFRSQARHYGFDEDKYLAAIEAVPRLSREAVDTGIAFFMKLADILSKLGYSNVRLARLLEERKQAEQQLKNWNETLERRVAERTAIAEDRTAQLRMLALQLAQAEQKERRRISDVLHEHFQQLLVGVKYNLSMVEPYLPDGEAKEPLRQASQVLDEAVQASRSLAVELSPPILHHSGLGHALGWLGGWMHDRYRLQVQVQADPAVDPLPEDLRVLLFQAARELLFNVVKHAGVSQARVEVKRQDQQVHLSVCDEGTGFDPRRSTAGSPTAPALGLFTLRERLGFLGGQMDIESTPGTGTCIRVWLPLPMAALAQAPSQTLGVATGEPSADRPVDGDHADSRRIRVLIADDHAIVRDGLMRLLHLQAGIQVIGQAEDGVQAIDLASQLRPDVVLMDVSMPNLDGIEATRSIRTGLPDTAVIGLSMHSDPGVEKQMVSAGATRYLTKTTPPERLVAAIRESASPDRPAGSA